MTFEGRQKLQKAVRERLESLQRAGVQQLPKADQAGLQGNTPGEIALGEGDSEAAVETPAVGGPHYPPASGGVVTQDQTKGAARATGWQPLGSGVLFETAESLPEISSAPSLAVLAQEVAPCTRCEELARTRTQTVFGVGDPHARLCFIGEAPGADEDRLGEPFVGRAGQLLNKIIEACGMRREDVYICNILKCRPPGNRNPLPIEAANCRRFLERQLELVAPEFVCCLGSIAAQNLLHTTASIGRLRGSVHAYRGARVVCTYHPAYLLRNPAAKKDTWEDMKLLMREMGVQL